MDSLITVEEVRALVRIQSKASLTTINHHGITLRDALVGRE